jgi:hypothetical protein
MSDKPRKRTPKFGPPQPKRQQPTLPKREPVRTKAMEIETPERALVTAANEAVVLGKEDPINVDRELQKKKAERAAQKVRVKEDPAFLRKLAGTIYTTAQTAVTMEKLNSMDPFVGRTTVAQLKRWCVEDEWKIQREDYLEDMADRLRNRIMTEQIERKVDTINQLQDLFEGLLTDVKMGEAPARSKEGLVNALVNVVKTIRDYQSDWLPTQPPEVDHTDDVDEAEAALAASGLTEDDLLAAAQGVLAQRGGGDNE